MRTALWVGLGLLFLLPGLLGAVVTCTANDDGGGQITVTVTSSDDSFSFFNTFVGSNASLGNQNCANPDGSPRGNNPCFWEAIQDAPGPATAEVEVTDGDGLVVCGPFDNSDGLPVNLVEFSID